MGKVYVIVTLPADTPVTNPFDELTVAILVFELLQVPPAVALFRLVVEFTQTLVVPVIAAGRGLTVADVVVVAEHELLLVTVRL